MKKLIEKLINRKDGRFLFSDNPNSSFRNFYPLLATERHFPIPTKGELAENIRVISSLNNENLQIYFRNIYMNLLDEFGKVPVLMELLKASYEFKEGLAYDKNFLTMAGLNYRNINGECFDRIRAGAARFYFNSVMRKDE